MTPGDLSGFWHGRYGGGGPGWPTVAFLAVLADDSGALSGSISEPNDVGGTTPELHAVVDGRRSGREVSFVKTYDGESDAAHSVGYAGTLSADGTCVTGTWVLEQYRGEFRMERTLLAADEVAAARAAEVEAGGPLRVLAPAIGSPSGPGPGDGAA